MARFAGICLIVAMPLFTWLDKKFSLSYRDHMDIIYLSTGKNNGTAIAMMAFTSLVALPAAALPLFQIIFIDISLPKEKTLLSPEDKSIRKAACNYRILRHQALRHSSTTVLPFLPEPFLPKNGHLRYKIFKYVWQFNFS